MVSNLEDRTVIFPFAQEESIMLSINQLGKKIKNKRINLKVINITATKEAGFPIIDTWEVESEKKLIDSLSILENEKDILQDFNLLGIILNDRISDIHKEATTLSICGNALSLFLNNDEVFDSKGQILLSNDKEGMLNIVYQTIDGNSANLTKEDIVKLIEVIAEIIKNNVSIDLKVDDNIKKLTAEIDYKIIEALPHNVKANKININTNAIINQIKKTQRESNEDE